MNFFRQAGIFVLAGALAIAGCKGEKGPAGAPGNNGNNGTNCTVANNADGSATITCTDGTSATVTKGTNGTNGVDGTSCQVTDNQNGTATISCSNGTTATVRNGTDGAGCVVQNNNNGTRTITCGNNTGVTVADAVVDFGVLSDAEKADAIPSIVVTDVTVPADGRAVVTLKVSDRKGNGIKGLSAAAPASISWRFGLLKLVAGVNGSANDTWVNYNGTATSTASAETASGTTLTDNGDGTYTFKFTKNILDADATKRATDYDAAAPHRLVVIFSKSVSGVNVFQPVNVVRDFVPAAGFAATPGIDGQNEKVDATACLECHTAFRAKAGGTGKFHGGARYDVRGCVACHNDQRRFSTLSATSIDGDAIDTTLPWTGNIVKLNGEGFINLPVFIHKIHMGEDLTQTGGGTGTYAGIPQPYETHYPQDVRNCAKCHRAVAKADNWKAEPSRRACGACHDNVSFAATVPAGRVAHSGGACASDLDCGGANAGFKCATCHSLTGSRGAAAVHVSVDVPNPGSTYAGGTNANTNAAYVAAAGVLPAGADKINYVVQSVSRDANKHPVIVFKLQRTPAGTTTAQDVVFADPLTATATSEMIPNFTGSPSAYFAFAVPQDGVAAPGEFNATASAYLKGLWNGSVAATVATMTGPDASGFYTVTLTGTVVPDTATMLTGGIGYTYSLSSAPPLVQTNLTATYPYTLNATTGKYVGGLIVPAPDVWKVATGYTARRTVVSNAKCNGCHAQLGAKPSFHAGQRNDAPTCSFCHRPNQTSSGWSANVKDFIHGVHGGEKRGVPFTWHQVSPTQGYWQVTYPAILNNCEQCHLPGTYDFSASASAAAVPNMLASTVGTGTYAAPAGTSTHSPYVQEGVPYGTGFSFTGATGAYVDAAATTLVVTPITAACSACHDAPLAIAHMESNGGAFYKARSAALVKDASGKALQTEQCLVCHGPGKVAAIGDVHK